MTCYDIDMMLSSPVKRVGYKTIRGAIRMLKAQNKKLKKMNCRVKFIIELPIKE